MLAGVTLKAAGVLPQAGSKARELQDPESHHIKKLLLWFYSASPNAFLRASRPAIRYAFESNVAIFSSPIKNGESPNLFNTAFCTSGAVGLISS